ncbi:hypothetical protein B0I37DRAFT_282 [Chaetomium sp. MPI-CAGE-AT-0009]|nr:hypothetical protein B0I37DRAFT_282 [Chaetomium sp. MPI-CAGE-AT-0009]
MPSNHSQAKGKAKGQGRWKNRNKGKGGPARAGRNPSPPPAGSTRATLPSPDSPLNPGDEVLGISMDGLTISGPDTAEAPVPIPAKKKKREPFRFLDLPPELRIEVYTYFVAADDVVDLNTQNHKYIRKKLSILKTCKLIYREASHVFYSINTFRIFPTQGGRYFKTKKPLLARLKPHQRRSLGSLELRLGPGWTSPPPGWVVNRALGLSDCVNVHKLTVFAEIDPSESYYDGYRKADGFYEGFCRDLLRNVLAELSSLNCVHFDGGPGVEKHGDMVAGLIQVAKEMGKDIRWGPQRGWTDHDEEEAKAA